MKRAEVTGFTLIETLAILAIVMILIGIGSLGVNRAIQNSKMNQIAIAISTSAYELETYITERGSLHPTVDETETEAAERFVSDFNANYSSMSFDVSTLSVTGSSFTVNTQMKTDAWGSKYLLYYSWSNEIFIAASAGPNMRFDFLTEKDAENVDDLLAAVRGK